MQPSIWTPELIAELTRLWNVEKLPANECARRLSEFAKVPISRNAALAKAHRLGLEGRPRPRGLENRTYPNRLAPLAGCSWIEGDPRKGDPACGKVRLPGRPYCAHHAARARGTPAPIKVQGRQPRW